MENALARRNVTIWNTLKKHYKKIDNTLMPPFINTADKFIGPGAIVDRVSDKIKLIVARYEESNLF